MYYFVEKCIILYKDELFCIETGDNEEGSIYGSLKCPVCRKKYYKEGIH